MCCTMIYYYYDVKMFILFWILFLEPTKILRYEKKETTSGAGESKEFLQVLNQPGAI